MKAPAVLAGFLAAASLAAAPAAAQGGPRMGPQDLAVAIEGFAGALARNDAAGIAQWLADDWIVIEGSGAIIGRTAFVGAIRSGTLVHDHMRFDERAVGRFGETATWTARARGSGRYGGVAFAFDERSTDVWVRRSGRWVCVLTQLTPITQSQAGAAAGLARSR